MVYDVTTRLPIKSLGCAVLSRIYLQKIKKMKHLFTVPEAGISRLS